MNQYSTRRQLHTVAMRIRAAPEARRASSASMADFIREARYAIAMYPGINYPEDVRVELARPRGQVDIEIDVAEYSEEGAREKATEAVRSALRQLLDETPAHIDNGTVRTVGDAHPMNEYAAGLTLSMVVLAGDPDEAMQHAVDHIVFHDLEAESSAEFNQFAVGDAVSSPSPDGKNNEYPVVFSLGLRSWGVGEEDAERRARDLITFSRNGRCHNESFENVWAVRMYADSGQEPAATPDTA